MGKDVGYYLSMGFDRTMAEYYAAGRKKIIRVKPNEDFTLTLDFDNGERRLYDCKPLLQDHTVFAPLQRYEDFKRVYLDAEHCVSWDIDPSVDSSVVWSNKVDLCPDGCYVDSKPMMPINADFMSAEELRTQIQAGYDDMQAGRVQDAFKAFVQFWEDHK